MSHDSFEPIGAVAANLVNRWSWWQAALKGSFGAITTTPEQGYYRCRYKGGQWEPVAIWLDEESGGWLAYRNGSEVHADDVWISACRHPITIEAYEKAMGGGGFDDEPEKAPGIGHNRDEVDPLDALRIEYLGEKELAEEFLRAPVKTRADADKAAIWSKRLADIAKRATDLHRVEKQPSLDECRRVDEKWRELRDDPKALATRLKRHIDDWLREEDRIERERQRLAREEADRLRREAEAAEHARRHADVLESEDTLAAREAEIDRLEQQAIAAEREAEARNAQAGRTGAKVALRTFVSAEITDFDALLIALKDRAEIREQVQSLANRAAKAGVELPGMKIVEERRAV